MPRSKLDVDALAVESFETASAQPHDAMVPASLRYTVCPVCP